MTSGRNRRGDRAYYGDSHPSLVYSIPRPKLAVLLASQTAKFSLPGLLSRLADRLARSRVGRGLQKCGVTRARAKRGLGIASGLTLGAVAVFGAIEANVERVAVLGFHDIIDPNLPEERPPEREPVESDYMRQDFERFLAYLVENDYWFLSAQDVYDHFVKTDPDPIPEEFRDRPRVAISIDDGYASAHAHLMSAAEAIQSRTGKTVKFIWFVNPAFLGRTDTELPRMTCNDLKAGYEAGFYDVQSHTANHQDLTTLDADDVRVEFKQARDQLVNCLDDRLRQVAQHVAYPFGAANETAIKYARRYHLSGYLYNSRFLSRAPWRDRYRLSRLPVNRNTSVEKLQRLAAGRRW